MVPLVGVPATIAKRMSDYRAVFCREPGFEHVSRYISGLLLSENKTLQGIYSQQVPLEGEAVSRRAMHAAVFEAGWNSETLMRQHRGIVGKRHQGQGREVISLDWTLSHHEHGSHIYGVKRSYDYVNHCMSCFQTVVTAVIANPQQLDGIAVEVQLPEWARGRAGIPEDDSTTQLRADGAGDATQAWSYYIIRKINWRIVSALKLR